MFAALLCFFSVSQKSGVKIHFVLQTLRRTLAVGEIDVEERDIEVSEIIQEYENGNLNEVFGAGTAAIIADISSFGYKENKYVLKNIDNPYGLIIKKKITDIQNNLCEDKFNWRYQVI